MRLRLPTINHRLPTCQSTARVCGLLDRVGDALAEERERLELKAIEMTRRNYEQTVAGRHRMMRRADREVADPRQVEAIVATCKIVSLAYTDAEGITIVPLNFGYVFDTESNHLTLYFHGSATGRKMDAVKAAGNALPVAFEMATDCEVVEGRTLCNWGEAFKSIVGNGIASIIDNLDEAPGARTADEAAGRHGTCGVHRPAGTRRHRMEGGSGLPHRQSARKAPAAYALTSYRT